MQSLKSTALDRLNLNKFWFPSSFHFHSDHVLAELGLSRMCKPMDIETLHSRQCLDFPWAQRSHGRPVWESSGTLQAARRCRSSFHFHFRGCWKLCSSTRASSSPYVPEAPGVCLQQPLERIPAARAGAREAQRRNPGWKP